MSNLRPVRVVYRSKTIQHPLMAAMKAADAWSQAGLDPGGDIEYVSGAAKADGRLINGDLDFIFGSHVTPYLRYDEGVPFVYLGQTVNYADDSVASARPMSEVEDLRGLRIADRLDSNSHPHGNHILFLRRAGIAEDEVVWIGAERHAELDLVAAGQADAAFVTVPNDRLALERGLHVFQPDPLPMVNASTMTTLWPTVQRDPDLCRAVLRAVRIGITFYQDEPEAMWKVMQSDVADLLGIDDEVNLRALYERNFKLLDRSLYPNPESVRNAFLLAVRQRPGLEERVHPAALWDVHFLRELDAAVDDAAVGAVASV
jgi:ABC-type nitrate/sulfonate/bicarbonate transport system substrate-binding protein